MKKEVIEDNEKLKEEIKDLKKQLEEVKDAIVYKANQCLRIDKELSEKLRKEKQAYINMYNMYDEEKKKNEKAIEYIENNNFHCKNQEEQKQYDRELFKILKGENKE